MPSSKALRLCAAMVLIFLTIMLAKREIDEDRVSLLAIWKISWYRFNKQDGMDCTYTSVSVEEESQRIATFPPVSTDLFTC
ncbi:hypothetical protein MLD38_032198 [Melastoma candidum]|uniref:Uncharacterized protein n=1 Tax=Melastoma candidum TaxID=119954 RepID=A0ACB9M3I8_9MYRT|nr:hypothetical protein MLD38_032198 [Melastoma candidum]